MRFLVLFALLLFLASGPALAHFGGYPVEEQPALLLTVTAGASLALLGALLLKSRQLRDDARFALRTVAARRHRFLCLVLVMAAFATGLNLLLLAAVTGHPPGRAGLGAGDVDPELLPPPGEPAISRFDAPLLWVEYPQWFDAVNDPAGTYRGMFPRANIPLRWSLTPHYLVDLLPLLVLLAAYMVLSQKFSRQRKFLKGAAALPGASTASTALTGLAASACCGAVTVGQVTQVVVVAGVGIAPSSLVLPSRLFIAAMALLLVLLVLRASRRIRTCPIAAGGGGP